MFITSCIILPFAGCASKISPINHRCNKNSIFGPLGPSVYNSSDEKDQIISALKVCRDALTSDLPTQSYS